MCVQRAHAQYGIYVVFFILFYFLLPETRECIVEMERQKGKKYQSDNMHINTHRNTYTYHAVQCTNIEIQTLYKIAGCTPIVFAVTLQSHIEFYTTHVWFRLFMYFFSVHSFLSIFYLRIICFSSRFFSCHFRFVVFRFVCCSPWRESDIFFCHLLYQIRFSAICLICTEHSKKKTKFVNFRIFGNVPCSMYMYGSSKWYVTEIKNWESREKNMNKWNLSIELLHWCVCLHFFFKRINWQLVFVFTIQKRSFIFKVYMAIWNWYVHCQYLPIFVFCNSLLKIKIERADLAVAVATINIIKATNHFPPTFRETCQNHANNCFNRNKATGAKNKE